MHILVTGGAGVIGSHSVEQLIEAKVSVRVCDNFSSGSVCLALASDYFEEADYYRDYDEFLEAVGRVK